MKLRLHTVQKLDTWMVAGSLDERLHIKVEGKGILELES
jgi:hypothetical protein